MPYYPDSQSLYATMQLLFATMRQQQPNPVDSLVDNKISIRFKFTEPEAEIGINARKNPVQVTFGEPMKIRPELDVQLDAETLHQILKDELSLSKAVGDRRMKVLGPVWKTFPLKNILDQGRYLYPRLLDSHK
jgi:hypothetical protein